MMKTRARALSGISHGLITHLSVGNPGAHVERLDLPTAAGGRRKLAKRRTSLSRVEGAGKLGRPKQPFPVT